MKRSLLLVTATMLASVFLTACDETTATTSSPAATSNIAAATCANPSRVPDSLGQNATTVTKTSDGLQYGDLTVGSGAAATVDQTITVQYTGWLQANGQQFDSSRKSGGKPVQFQLSAGQLIQGWVEGVPGMKVCGRRQLIVPPALGYGASGQGPIPPNATLVFDIELISIP